jgi:hypothetical protein
MTNRLFLALFCVLLVVRLPSLVQPMGADQALYSYVGERILAGELPYRDAWDQKPPAVHFTYAAIRAAWPHDASVPAADLVVAAAIAALLVALGASAGVTGIGRASAIIFLLLSNPAFARLGGVRVRAQCETFIALAITAALVAIARSRDKGAAWHLVVAGLCLGIAFVFKYNTAAYGFVAVAALAIWNRCSIRALALIAAGGLVPIAAVLLVFARGGALWDLYQATITYNVRYSGETYGGALAPLTYLVTFPVRHASVDGLWLVGGAGCALLLVAGIWKRERWLPVAWVAAACLSITINGSRDLPQYFIQAAPALALAAAWGGSLLWTRRPLLNLLLIAVVGYGVWRVNDFTKLGEQTWRDTQYALGRTSRTEFLAEYGDRTAQKYSALANVELGEFMQAHSLPQDRVFVFGFSCAAYLHAQRASASRFFWSRPVIAGFNEGTAGYGVSGMLAELQRTPPAIVALQVRDWMPDVDDSAHFFLSNPALASWLQGAYTRVEGPEGYEVWTRRDMTP